MLRSKREIDRVLKRVQEGVDVFDSIWNKVYDADNENQREKFEVDLKKEMKKLQRYRDQIKIWLQSPEIRDKRALMDARKQIERKMERFIDLEKGKKRNAFSNEGFSQKLKNDPRELAKAKTRDWLNYVVSDLENQIDNFEAESVALSFKKRELRPPRLVHLEKSIERHKAHLMKLESILRLLVNNQLSPEQVDDVKDFIEDYVERNQEDFDEFGDIEDLYSLLTMEELEAHEGMSSLASLSRVEGISLGSTSATSSVKSSFATSPTQGVSSISTSASFSMESSGATSPTQALTDGREQIDQEMERFKFWEKEKKTKAFSNEGLSQKLKITVELNVLERILEGTEEPSHLDLSLLQSITENYSEERKIGNGGCGDVYKGILRNGVVAVKRLFKSRTIKDKMFHREVQSLIITRHENIVRFLGYCSYTEEHAIIFEGGPIMVDIRERLLCFEYMNNGSLESHLTDELRGLEWDTRYEIIMGICMGLLYLHNEKDIIHMDLKPSNILLDDKMVPKITDFGLSRIDNYSQTSTTLLMSPGYCAPEYLLHGEYSSKSDIYSLGVTILELVTGSKKKPDQKVLRRWRHRWIKSLKHAQLSYQQVTKCLELAERCMQHDPTGRPDISDIIYELNEIDSKDSHLHVIPYMEDMLGAEPLEIHIPFELYQQISHSIELTNDTDDYIAFITKTILHRLSREPDKGLVRPRSKCSVTVTMQAPLHALPNNHCKEEISILSTRVDGGLAAMDISGDMFSEKEGKVVDEVNVMVVFGAPPSVEES